MNKTIFIYRMYNSMAMVFSAATAYLMYGTFINDLELKNKNEKIIRPY